MRNLSSLRNNYLLRNKILDIFKDGNPHTAVEVEDRCVCYCKPETIARMGRIRQGSDLSLRRHHVRCTITPMVTGYNKNIKILRSFTDGAGATAHELLPDIDPAA